MKDQNNKKAGFQQQIHSAWDAVILMGDFNTRIEGYQINDPKTGKKLNSKDSTFNSIN